MGLQKSWNPININEFFPDDCANFYPVELYFYKRLMGNEKSFFTLCPFWNFCIKEKYDSRDNAFFMLTILTQIKIMHSDKINCGDIFFYVVYKVTPSKMRCARVLFYQLYRISEKYYILFNHLINNFWYQCFKSCIKLQKHFYIWYHPSFANIVIISIIYTDNMLIMCSKILLDLLSIFYRKMKIEIFIIYLMERTILLKNLKI